MGEILVNLITNQHVHVYFYLYQFSLKGIYRRKGLYEVFTCSQGNLEAKGIQKRYCGTNDAQKKVYMLFSIVTFIVQPGEVEINTFINLPSEDAHIRVLHMKSVYSILNLQKVFS